MKATEKKAGTAKELDQESVVVTQDRHHYVFTLEAPYTIPANWKARENNIIVAVDGVRVDRDTDLSTLITQHRPGDTITLRVLRDNSTLSVDVTLGELPPQN